MGQQETGHSSFWTVVFLVFGQLLLFLTCETASRPYNTVSDYILPTALSSWIGSPKNTPAGTSTSWSSRRLLLSSSSTSGENEEELYVDSANSTSSSQLEIVLCTHLSVDKLDRLAVQQNAWTGPMSVAVYLASDEDESKYQKFRSVYDRNDTAMDIVFSTYREHNASLIDLYPHNILRNLAIQHAQSDYILSLDGDFLPSRNAHLNLTIKLRNDASFRESLQNQTVYILPVFALQNDTTKPPSTRDELVTMYHNQSAKEWHYATGHARIRYQVWIPYDPSHAASSPFSYPIEVAPEFEPYFLCYRPNLPQYWETFRGFGFDKTSFTHELALMGYQFRVLWDHFVVHLHHERDGSLQDRNHLGNRNGNLWWKEFTPYLRDKYQPKGAHRMFLYPKFGDYYRMSRQRGNANKN